MSQLKYQLFIKNLNKLNYSQKRKLLFTKININGNIPREI